MIAVLYNASHMRLVLTRSLAETYANAFYVTWTCIH